MQALVLISPALLIAAGVFGAAIGLHVTGNRWGSVAGIAVLVYPLNAYASATLYPQALATALVLALALFGLTLDSRRNDHGGGAAVMIGLAGAALTLAVPVLGFTAVAMIAAMAWRRRSRRARFATLSVLAFALPIAAWTTRNWIQFHKFIPVSSSSGLNLLIGNNPAATPTSGVDVDITSYRERLSSIFPERFDDISADGRYQHAAIEWITGHPGDAAVLFLGKTANYFVPYNAPVTAAQGSSLQELIAYAAFALLLAGVACRIALRKSLPVTFPEKLWLWLFVANAPVMAVFFTRVRFRQPLDALLAVEFAVGMVVLIAAIRAHRSGSAKGGQRASHL
ncbi:hypothetical protein [Williamsia herbipolensis]|uniref:hypothetical protein n=1 Tax=Williamsia herbipolensis TaxID=1603258 RepID=UPI0005F7F0C8|nr:hypothetical protein [Williamsia herbipolensis]